MRKAYVALDNGITASWSAFIEDSETNACETRFGLIPDKRQIGWQKSKKSSLHRIDWEAMKSLIDDVMARSDVQILYMERPMINPSRYVASMSARACLEAMLIVMEMTRIPFAFMDSREWQKEMLPKGLKGAEELKKASMDVGIRLFPQFKELICKHKDADGLLMGEYIRRRGF